MEGGAMSERLHARGFWGREKAIAVADEGAMSLAAIDLRDRLEALELKVSAQTVAPHGHLAALYGETARCNR
jgi:hypothetical protein